MQEIARFDIQNSKFSGAFSIQKGGPKSSETAQRIRRGTTGAPKWDEGDVKKKIGKKGRKKGAEKILTSATLGAFLFPFGAAGG